MTLWLWCSCCGYQRAGHAARRCPSCRAPAFPAVQQDPSPGDLAAARQTIRDLPAIRRTLRRSVQGRTRFRRLVLP